MANDEVIEKLKEIRMNLLINKNFHYANDFDTYIKALDIAINNLLLQQDSNITRGGIFVPLSEVQNILLNISRQINNLNNE